jgi:hypothetical protein
MRFPRLAYNTVSAAGAVLALIATIVFVVLFLISLFLGEPNPYLGIVLYLIIPFFVLAGLVLIPAGMLRHYRRIKRGVAADEAAWPRLDLNQKSHRNATLVFLVSLVVFLLISAVGAYQGYHYTESVKFCGETCHPVMLPEITAYHNSSHARVKCVDCHIGSGAGWYAKSKLSGAYQVYATLANLYPRPVPTPISNLRPAQETCEQCHWPERFFGAQQIQFNHYMYNDSSSHWPINMLIKVGGGDPKTGQTSGIHWHMNIGAKVEYIARDEKRMDIPWVRVTDLTTGRVTVYQNQAAPLSAEEIAAATPRRMDCMDCHNRPSHNYHSPDEEVDRLLLTGQIDASLPAVKRVAVEAMSAEYETTDVALRGIANYMTEFYREQHADLYQTRRVAVDAAIVATQQAFSANIFPEMKAKWSEYPDQIGHFSFPGCMRCHEGTHVSEEGLTLSRECHTCHTIIAQGEGERRQISTTEEGLDFEHPEDIGEAWKETGCYECHAGTQP